MKLYYTIVINELSVISVEVESQLWCRCGINFLDWTLQTKKSEHLQYVVLLLPSGHIEKRRQVSPLFSPFLYSFELGGKTKKKKKNKWQQEICDFICLFMFWSEEHN